MAGDFFRGFMQGFAPVVAQSITQSAEAHRQRLQDETDFLQRKTLDPNASQAERDAALYALTQLASSKKPGKGLQAYEKKVKETTAAETQGVKGPYGMVAGQPAPAGAEGGTGPMGAPGAAALPATSPIAGVGSAQEPENPEGKDLGGPPPPPAMPTASGPTAGTPPAPPPRPDETALLAKGAEMGMTPPQRYPKPAAPNAYTARKLDLDFYKQDMLEYKAAEDRYVDYLNRIAQLVYQEKKQKETQTFERSERLETQEFKSKESTLERKSAEKVAGMRVRETTSATDKEATLRERQALAAWRRDMQQISRDKNKYEDEGGLKGAKGVNQQELERRTREADELYEAATGKPAPTMGEEGPPEPEPRGARGGGARVQYLRAPEEGPPGPPARAKDLDTLKGGKEVRAVVERLRRAKLTPEQVCAKIAGSPSLPDAHKRAALAHAQCPEK